MLIALAMLAACLACGFAGYWLGRLDGDTVDAYADGFEAGCAADLAALAHDHDAPRCRLTPVHGMLPADQEPAAEYTEHSPSHLYFEQVARRFNPDLGDHTCN